RRECGLRGSPLMLLTGVERMVRVLDLISRQDARHRLVVALFAATAVTLSLRGHVHASTEAIATWDAFVFCVLLLAWLTILTTPVQKLRSRAREQDVGRLVIFVFVVVAACAALFAVGFLISVNKAELHGHVTAHLILALGTVVFSWSVVHTVFGLRYAHAFMAIATSRAPMNTRAVSCFQAASKCRTILISLIFRS